MRTDGKTKPTANWLGAIAWDWSHMPAASTEPAIAGIVVNLKINAIEVDRNSKGAAFKLM
jgi:hypothetical protein